MSRITNGEKILNALEKGNQTVTLTRHDRHEFPFFEKANTKDAARFYLERLPVIAPERRIGITADNTRERAKRIAQLMERI